jgi:alkylhydroperoxidase/carboxymuconolactone decarboxylase family protein YurZ
MAQPSTLRHRICTRPGLELVEREIVTIAALAALGTVLAQRDVHAGRAHLT